MRLVCLLVAILIVIPAVSFAAGAHESLNCTGCHGIHTAKGDLIFAIAPNQKSLNPRTKKPYTGVTALCLGCHESAEKGGMGIMPISAAMSHPYGIAPNPKVASVPAVALRDGKLGCVGCHDPHPSNPNYKYLRVDTKGGVQMQKFCSMCHPSKSGKKILRKEIFNSMDERK